MTQLIVDSGQLRHMCPAVRAGSGVGRLRHDTEAFKATDLTARLSPLADALSTTPAGLASTRFRP